MIKNPKYFLKIFKMRLKSELSTWNLIQELHFDGYNPKILIQELVLDV